MSTLFGDNKCKNKKCPKPVKNGVSQSKVFCSNKCRIEYKAYIKSAGIASNAFDVGEQEALDRHKYLSKARKGSKAALRKLKERWGINSVWNPTTQREMRI